MRMRMPVWWVAAMIGCGGAETSAETSEPVAVTQAPAPRLSETRPQLSCEIGRTPANERPSVDVDVVTNIVVRSAAEARDVIDRHSPPGTDPDALFAVAHAQTDLYRLEHDTQVLQEAIRTWAQLVQTAPSYPQMDQVFYFLAWALGEMNEHTRARQVYHRLIRHYPQSPLIVVAYIEFGDHYVREGDGMAARRFYERARDMLPEDEDLMHAYLAYGWAWASSIAGESVDPAELQRARLAANDGLRAAIEADWCN